MSQLTRARILSALDALEEAECRNIAWGLLDESWTRQEIISYLDEHWPGEDPEGCIESLIEARDLVEVPRQWPARYRTRMAEAVRLFSHLRQLFSHKPWATGSRLVADYRFLRQPRSFPHRDIAPADAVRSLSEGEVSDKVLIDVNRVLAQRSLSKFQVHAAASVFSALASESDRGVVVGAGTGSGKTLSFYLPALSQLSAGGASGPRVVAIYPRNELLKDQLSTALREVRSLHAAGGRQLTVGAYFGPTPFSGEYEPSRRDGWRPTSSGWICPFLKCPSSTPTGVCGGDLLWRNSNRTSLVKGQGTLVCQRCGDSVTSSEFLLTRKAIQAQPPDILFTTTEMLNLCMSDGWSMHVFGIGSNATRPPNLILLDEIHTYTGTSGAQVAFLLRRWRRRLGRPVTWVGLSATLANASEFFSGLCGVPVEAIVDIRPDPEDMIQQGSEYQLLLRGDPASQSALLSTSIQSLMLLRRILDSDGSELGSVYGSRVFAFLENLDLVNRLYRQLLDAEGRDAFGHPNPNKDVLAGLRLPVYAQRFGETGDWPERDLDGQYWWLAEKLGFGSRSLVVTRTSSQDSGVDSVADIVVATSALEVGYDDPRVGAVLQHKAPRDLAQFLQRRGRAGRVQTQRPWTVVVLSDYGRDRIAYQQYETLFDPAIPAKNLPLGNQSVRKMQAARCLIDWVGHRLRVEKSRRNVRRLWTSPSHNVQAVRECTSLLQEVMDGGPAQADLIGFVQTSLGLSQEETQSVCWEHPRSLLLETVPTAYRRLASAWATVQSGEVKPGTDVLARQPLPDFIPRTLFSDLDLPEVEIDPPEGYDPTAETSLAIGMALNELAPGKVTLRWAVTKIRGLWIEPPEGGAALALEDRMAPGGEVLRYVTTPEGSLPLVRPITIRPTMPHPEIRSTSNGRLNWQFTISDDREGTEIPRPRNGPLGELIPDVQAHLNADRGPLKTWRYALEASAETVTQSGRTRRDVRFSWNGQPAALGFASIIDALVVSVNVPTSIHDFYLESDLERLRQLRADRFLVLTKVELERLGVGPFPAAWVTEVVLAVAARATLDGSGIDSLHGLGTSEWRSLAERVVDGVLLATKYTDTDETPLRETVLDTLEQLGVAQAVEGNLAALNSNPDASWLPWIRGRFLQTVAAAWQEAAQQICLDFNLDTDALVDVIDDGKTQATLVASDSVPGGGGLIETLTRRISDDPRQFDRLIAASLESTESELVDPALRKALVLLVDSHIVADAARVFRSEKSGRLEAWQSLAEALANEGVTRTHANLAALAARVFRPGSSPESDALLRMILEAWETIDVRAGFAIDHRTVCAFLAEDPNVRQQLARVAASGREVDETSRAQTVLLSLLWTRACARRPEALRTSNRFASNPPLTERTLLKALLPTVGDLVDIDDSEWRASLSTALRRWGSARVTSGRCDAHALSEALRDLMVEPLEVDWLQVYPRIEGTTRDGAQYTVRLALREAPQ